MEIEYFVKPEEWELILKAGEKILELDDRYSWP
jgi:hypothetical protein